MMNKDKENAQKKLVDIISAFPVDEDPIWFSDKSFYEKRGGGRYQHNAVDIFGYWGEYNLILSSIDGKIPSKVKIRSGGKTKYVPGCGYSKKGGYYVYIQSGYDKNIIVYHAHLDRIDSGIRLGASVTDLSIIGEMGCSGNAIRTGSHLHYQVKFKNTFLDPTKALLITLKEEKRKKQKLDKKLLKACSNFYLSKKSK